MFLLLLILATGLFAGDPNVPDEPNYINTVAQWLELSDNPQVWNRHYVLTADIDLAGQELKPIGNRRVPFTGSLIGGGYTLKNAVIYCPADNCVGMFGYLGKDGLISELAVENVTVSGKKYVGALAGYVYLGTIICCKSTGVVSGSDITGGLVGYNTGLIGGCYSLCRVESGNIAGGLIGYNEGLAAMVRSCYAAGAINAPEAGGLVGRNSGLVYGSFWNVEAAGVRFRSAGRGLTCEEMKNEVIFRRACWSEYNWVMDAGKEWPRLDFEMAELPNIPESDQVLLAGQGTQEDPYLITSEAEFILLGQYSQLLSKHLRLMVDLDMKNVHFDLPGELGPFTGVFDGGGHVIRNMAINSSGDNTGLFGVVNGGRIVNLGLAELEVNGRNSTGGICGIQYGGSISSCFVSGQITGQNDTGGLAGVSMVTGR